MKKCTILALVLAAMYGTLHADSFSLSFSQNMASNLFQNRFVEKDQLSDLSFYLDKSFSMLSFFVEGKYSYLFENSNLAYYIQDAGMDYIVPVSEKSAFYFSLAVILAMLELWMETEKLHGLCPRKIPGRNPVHG